MVLVDANVLLYAVDSRSAHHTEALRWLEAALGGGDTVAFSWVVLLAFIRIASHPSILTTPMTGEEAVAQVESWLGAPGAVVAAPTPGHAAVLRGLLRETTGGGNLTTDAHLAALAVEHGAEVVSYDRDFARFAGVISRPPG